MLPRSKKQVARRPSLIGFLHGVTNSTVLTARRQTPLSGLCRVVEMGGEIKSSNITPPGLETFGRKMAISSSRRTKKNLLVPTALSATTHRRVLKLRDDLASNMADLRRGSKF